MFKPKSKSVICSPKWTSREVKDYIYTYHKVKFSTKTSRRIDFYNPKTHVRVIIKKGTIISGETQSRPLGKYSIHFLTVGDTFMNECVSIAGVEPSGTNLKATIEQAVSNWCWLASCNKIWSVPGSVYVEVRRD